MAPSDVSAAREEALRRLRRIESEGAYVGLVDADDAELDDRDLRFATELVAGVTRWRRWLDFLISQFYRGDAASLELDVRLILRIGLYELLIMESPPHAAVNESVGLAGKVVRKGAAGLVNGILRAVARANPLPRPRTGDEARDLAIRHSHPTWMVRRWVERYGPDETVALLEWNNTRPIYGLRVNLSRIEIDAFHRRLTEIGVQWEASPYAEDFVRVRALQAVLRAGLVREGLCAVQDEAAGMVVHVLDPRPGERIADACAAPGGKAIYAAQRMADRGRIVAVDVHKSRVRLIGRTAERLGLGIIDATVGDARQLSELARERRFDRILLDAPCSGLGVLNKRADLRWRRTLEQMQELTELQTELLQGVADAVASGGLLVYSTCSIEPEENQEQVERFLERRPDFRLEDAAPLVPEELSLDGYYRTEPHRHGVDGAFGARLRRIH